MCGYTGIFSLASIQSHPIINATKAIKHRGPDDSLLFSYSNSGHFYACTFSSETSKLKYPFPESQSATNWIGFNRLSIIDASDKGMQPIFDEEKQIAILFNGEIYNYEALKLKYFATHAFHSGNDTEVIFELYKLLGEDFILQLRGMFSIAIISYKEQTIQFWRDRFGLKPLYYHIDNNRLLFASEIKSLFATRLIDKDIDFQGLAYSCYLTTAPAPYTIYKNVHQLEPGCSLKVDLQSLRSSKTRYWHLSYNPTNEIINPEELWSDMQTCSRLANTGNINKSIMLSGGMDSGILAQTYKKTKVGAINIFDAANEETNENKFAKYNAKCAGIILNSIQIPSLSADSLLEYATYEEDPNDAPEAAYLLSKYAKSLNNKVIYNAIGLDELFGGYQYFQQAEKLRKYFESKTVLSLAKFLFPYKKDKFNTLLQNGTVALPFITRNKIPWNALQKVFKDNGSKDWLHPVTFILEQIKGYFPEFDKLSIQKQISLVDIHYYISNHHSMRSDQGAMRNSVEMRFPFLDHFFVEKYFNNTTILEGIEKELKPLIKNVAIQHLDNRVLQMSKKGFTMTNAWVQNSQLKDYALEQIQTLPFVEELQRNNLLQDQQLWKWLSLSARL